MAELKWLGPPGTGADGEVPVVSDVTTKRATALTSAQIDSQIAAGLTGYSLKSYVDSADSAKALKTYVDSQDATKLLRTSRGAANGAVPLDSSGLIPKLNVTNSYPNNRPGIRWGYTPASYTGDQTNLTSRDQVKMAADIAIPDPGWKYKLLPFGYWECALNTAGGQAWPEIRIKVGTEVIGWGRGGFNILEGHACQVLPYDPNDVVFSGAVTVTCWGGRNRWGTSSATASLYQSASFTPAKLLILQAVAE